jgi:TetR/AcrR family transcriptional regulator, cholesterol catabolism regulator
MAKVQTRPKGAPAENGTAGGAVETNGKSQRRRQELIDAAAKIFQDKGYEAASIQDVADALGILKGSVYYYIDSKEDLLFAAIQEVHESALANMDHIRELDEDPLTLIRLFIESHVRHVSDNLVKATVFFHDFRSLDPERHDYIVKERDSYDAFLRDLIMRGQREGVICRDIEPKLATLALLGMMNWTYQWYRVDGGMDPSSIGRQFADLALAGLACDPETHKTKHRTQLGKIPANITLSDGGEPIVKEPRKRVAAT